MLRLVLGVGRPDRAVDCVESDQSLPISILLQLGHRAPGRGETWGTGQRGRRRGRLTVDIEPPVTNEVQLVEDGPVWAEKRVECVMTSHASTLPTDMKHLTPTGG